jgi:hypothetical protein
MPNGLMDVVTVSLYAGRRACADDLQWPVVRHPYCAVFVQNSANGSLAEPCGALRVHKLPCCRASVDHQIQVRPAVRRGRRQPEFRHMDDRETLSIVLPIYQQIVLGIS